MSDFGASIFDDRNPPPPPPPRRREPPPAASAPTPAAVEAVPLVAPTQTRDDLDDVVFARSRPAPAAPSAKPAAKPAAPVRSTPAPPPPRPSPAGPQEAGPQQVGPQQAGTQNMRPNAADAPRQDHSAGSAAPRSATQWREHGRNHGQNHGPNHRREPAAAVPPADQHSWREHQAPTPRTPRPDAEPTARPESPAAARRPRDVDAMPAPARQQPVGPATEQPRPRGSAPLPAPRGTAPATRELPRGPRQPHGQAAPPTPAPAAAVAPTPAAARSDANKGLIVLVDLPALQQEAQHQGGELAQRRLLGGIAGGRDVAKALCVHAPGDKLPAGFHGIAANDGLAAGVRLAALAFEAAAAGARILLAPASPPMRQLAEALTVAGHRAELASFGTELAAGAAQRGIPLRQLGRECLFVP